jgi:hypothetical protein
MILAARHGIKPKTVAKWRKRAHVTDARMSPKEGRSTVLSVEEEAAVVVFRRHTLLPLDDASMPCRQAFASDTLKPARCLQRHGISWLPPRSLSSTHTITLWD